MKALIRKMTKKYIVYFFSLIALILLSVLVRWKIIPKWKPLQAQRFQVINLANIIRSHWNIETQIMNIQDYKKGDIENYEALFLLSENYGKEIHSELFYDILSAKEQEVIWSGFGSEKLVSALLEKDIDFQLLVEEFSTLEYKNLQFELTELDILNETKWPESGSINVLASLKGDNNRYSPFIIDIHDRYLILPFKIEFNYLIDSPALIFLDVLHNSFGHHNGDKKALIRLEDIDAYTYRDTKKLQEVYSYLKTQEIPFHPSIITRYINKTENIDLEIGDNKDLIYLLTKMHNEGLATLIQHGYTHQRGNGISGIDYEFWDPENNAPIKGDSPDFVRNRIKNARQIMEKNGLPVPDIWETPHYALSNLDNDIINSMYPYRYEHIPRIGILPFAVKIDSTIYFPENLGYIGESESRDDIIHMKGLLKKLSVFEDPIVSFFWHPYLNIEEVKSLIKMIQEDGYTFVSAYDLVDNKEIRRQNFKHSNEINNEDKKNVLLLTSFTERNNSKLLFFFILFSCFIAYGIFLYIRNRYRLTKYYKKLESPKRTIRELQRIAQEKNKKFPMIAIFVPARNEGYVIGNTIKSLAELDYPKDSYQVFIIVDEREMDDDVEILTKDVVNELSEQINKKCGVDLINILEIPKWYSGNFDDTTKTYKNSTKGRALNYALQHLYDSDRWKDTELIGLLDADGRFEKNTLKDVAYKSLTMNSKLIQGPVFQVSNFDNVPLIGIGGGLELAIHHMTEVPARLLSKRKKLQLLSGTNYFVDVNLIMNIGGWNCDSLVEDADLALKVYEQKQITAQWLTWPEIEQTIPSFATYRRQRERWFMGYLDLIKDVKRAKIPLFDKVRFISKTYFLIFRVVLDLGALTLGWILVISGFFRNLPPPIYIILLCWMIISIIIWDMYGLVYRKIAYYINPKMKTRHKVFQSIKLLFFMPLFVILQSIPKITAFVKHIFKVNKGVWYKTERTKEVTILIAENHEDLHSPIVWYEQHKS